MNPLPKEYIGDGIYIKDNGFDVILTTENGVSIQNRIVIEPSEWKAIKNYFERVISTRQPMELFEENPNYCGLVVFNDAKSKNDWSINIPKEWTWLKRKDAFCHPCGSMVRLLIAKDMHYIGGFEIQRVLFVDKPNDRVKEYILSRVQSGITGMETRVEFAKKET